MRSGFVSPVFVVLLYVVCHKEVYFPAVLRFAQLFMFILNVKLTLDTSNSVVNNIRLRKIICYVIL